jgi:hypothetical protein
MLWGEEQTQKWHNAVFSTPAKTEIVENLICLSAPLHMLWGQGLMGLQPISMSDDKTTLTLQIYWFQDRTSTSSNPRAQELVSLLEVPSLDFRLEDADIFRYSNALTNTPICSGDELILTTDNPKIRPLPSFALLDLQWKLQRVAALSGAAEPRDDWPDDESSDGEIGLDIGCPTTTWEPHLGSR